VYFRAASFPFRGRTVNPGELAQTLVPSELKIAALSMLPVATRLEDDVRERCARVEL